MNHELVDTARLLVAAVQDSDGFSSEYLRKLIVHLVPQLIGEVEILSQLASAQLSVFQAEDDQGHAGLSPSELLSHFDRQPKKKGRKGNKKKRRKKR